jgi:hypothetical protein
MTSQLYADFVLKNSPIYVVYEIESKSTAIRRAVAELKPSRELLPTEEFVLRSFTVTKRFL